jgi:hypothetical protein
MAKKQNKTRAEYDHFMHAMTQELGISRQEIRNIFKQHGITRFKQKPKSELKAILRAFVFMDDNKEKHFQPPPIDIDAALACPVPGCDGERKHVHRTKNLWKCSEGGSLHYHIFRVAHIIANKRVKIDEEPNVDKIMEWLINETKEEN